MGRRQGREGRREETKGRENRETEKHTKDCKRDCLRHPQYLRLRQIDQVERGQEWEMKEDTKLCPMAKCCGTTPCCWGRRGMWLDLWCVMLAARPEEPLFVSLSHVLEQ